MQKNRLWLYTLVFAVPFIGRAIDSNCESITNNKSKESAIDTRPDFDELRFSSRKIGDTKIKLIDDFDYGFAPKTEVSVISGNCVKYISSSGNTMVRKRGTITWRNFNPGAIRPGAFTRKMGAIGSANGFAIFPDEATGMHALKTLLHSNTYANMKICDAVHKYAPACDNNNPIQYKNNLYRLTGIDVNRKLGDLNNEELNKIAGAIKVLEGWIPGYEEMLGAHENLVRSLYVLHNGHSL